MKASLVSAPSGSSVPQKRVWCMPLPDRSKLVSARSPDSGARSPSRFLQPCKSSATSGRLAKGASVPESPCAFWIATCSKFFKRAKRSSVPANRAGRRRLRTRSVVKVDGTLSSVPRRSPAVS